MSRSNSPAAPDAMAIKGQPNILYRGDYARRFRQLAHLDRMNPPAANG